jgi:hypothetical protein
LEKGRNPQERGDLLNVTPFAALVVGYARPPARNGGRKGVRETVQTEYDISRPQIHERNPRTGWIRENVKLESINTMPVMAYERKNLYFKKGNTVGSAP